MQAKLKAAHAKINELYQAGKLDTTEWDAAMAVVRSLREQSGPQEFFSVDSGQHRTILSSGRIINPGNM